MSFSISAGLNLNQVLREKQRYLAVEEGKAEQLRETLAKHDREIEEFTGTVQTKEEALKVLQALEGSWHRVFENRLAGLVSRGLTVVFSEDLQFTLETSKRGELSAMDFKLVQTIRGEKLTTDIIGAKGGGVVAVAAFLLRVLILMAARPPLRQVLILDESFAMVSQEFVPNLASLLRQICDETGVQLILVTHEPLYGQYADRVYEVTQVNGESRYTTIKSHASHTVQD